MPNQDWSPDPPRDDAALAADRPATTGDASSPEIIAAPATGLPVPPGAPIGYRGYGVTGDWELEPPQPVTEDTESVTVVAQETVAVDERDWVLRLPDGAGLIIDRPLLLGRSPDSAAAPVGARLVAVDDPARTVSRSHLVIEVTGHGELLLRNVSAVNALVLTGEDGAEAKVAPDATARLTEASRVLVGAFPLTFERLEVR